MGFPFMAQFNSGGFPEPYQQPGLVFFFINLLKSLKSSELKMVGCKKLQRAGALLGRETYPPAHAGTHRTADTWTLHVSDVNGCPL